MLKVSNVDFDVKNKIIIHSDSYNLGDKIIKIEQIRTKDLGDFIKVTETKNGKKIRSSIRHLDKDTFEKVKNQKTMWDLFFKCDEE